MEPETTLVTEGGEGYYQYVGQVDSEGNKHGIGRWIYNHGYMIYEGQWRHGKKHGYARECFGTGVVFEGFFKDGDRHGLGQETDRSGVQVIKKGLWKDNVFQGAERYKDKNFKVGLFVHSLFKGNTETMVLPAIPLYRGLRE